VRIPAKMACNIMSASQIYTVQSLFSAAGEYLCATCLAQREAKKATLLAAYSEDIAEAERIGPEIVKQLTPLQKKIKKIIEESGGQLTNLDMIKLVNIATLHALMETTKFTVKKSTKLPAFYKMATSRDPNSHEGRLEIIRNAATIASLFLAIPSVISTNPGADLLGASMDTIATFAYPVWDKQ
jgi:hypothetical protein